MANIKGGVVILNGTPARLADYKPVSGSGFIYEVIRLIEGNYLFLDDHIDRMIQSCMVCKLASPEIEQIKKDLKDLVAISSIKNGNVKLTLNHTKDSIDIACFYIAHHYPTAEEYSNGVKLKSYAFERPDPNIKKWNENFRRDVRAFIDREKIYEAVLLNSENRLTEGSRSNIFFIDRDGRIITAPTEFILPGITRKYILKICKEENFPIVEKLLNIEDIKNMEACFLSGTSPMVLPVKQLDNHLFDAQHRIINTIKKRYLELAMK